MYRIEILDENGWLHTVSYTPPPTAADNEKALALRYSQNQGHLKSLEDTRALVPPILRLIKASGCIRIVDGAGNVCA
jgi:hypothetical protein